jgi:hypothetical protein
MHQWHTILPVSGSGKECGWSWVEWGVWSIVGHSGVPHPRMIGRWSVGVCVGGLERIFLGSRTREWHTQLGDPLLPCTPYFEWWTWKIPERTCAPFNIENATMRGGWRYHGMALLQGEWWSSGQLEAACILICTRFIVWGVRFGEGHERIPFILNIEMFLKYTASFPYHKTF